MRQIFEDLKNIRTSVKITLKSGKEVSINLDSHIIDTSQNSNIITFSCGDNGYIHINCDDIAMIKYDKDPLKNFDKIYK